MLRIRCNRDGSVSAEMCSRVAARIAGFEEYGFGDLAGVQAEFREKLAAAWISAGKPSPMLENPVEPDAELVEAAAADLASKLDAAVPL